MKKTVMQAFQSTENSVVIDNFPKECSLDVVQFHAHLPFEKYRFNPRGLTTIKTFLWLPKQTFVIHKNNKYDIKPKPNKLLNF